MQEDKPIKEEKEGFHKKSKHKFGYDFPNLIKFHPDLKPFVSENEHGIETLDFSNPKAVKELNRALLFYHYDLRFWDFPEGFLCPPVPSREDYVHHIADLLAEDDKEGYPEGQEIRGMDVGVGANCIYPIIGNRRYGWNFIASDIDAEAVKSSEQIVNRNRVLKYQIEVRHQQNRDQIFKGVLRYKEFLEFTMCNPPFYGSHEEAMIETQRKWKNLKGEELKDMVKNFFGKNAEIYCAGGEIGHISKIIGECQAYSKQILWFTTLVSRKENIEPLYKKLRDIKVKEIKTIEMEHGQKKSRILAWTYFNKKEREDWWSRKRKQSSRGF